MSDALGYIRVSSEEQADSGLGLEAQRQRIAAYSAMKGLHLAAVFEDPGISGGKPLANRPAGGKLLAAAKQRKAVVIVSKLDRLFRSVADAATVIADFDKKGIQLVSIGEGFDMISPYGRAMAQMASVFAELERAMIRERTRTAMNVKRSRGERISGYAPFGWDFGSGGQGRQRSVREEIPGVTVRVARAAVEFNQAKGRDTQGVEYFRLTTLRTALVGGCSRCASAHPPGISPVLGLHDGEMRVDLESQIAAKSLGNLATWPRYNFVNPSTPPICLAACLRYTS